MGPLSYFTPFGSLWGGASYCFVQRHIFYKNKLKVEPVVEQSINRCWYELVQTINSNTKCTQAIYCETYFQVQINVAPHLSIH